MDLKVYSKKKLLKSVLYALAAMLILILAGCSANPMMNKSESYEPMYEAVTEEEELAVERIDYEFEKDQLSSLALKAFEQRAIQKISDFADYLNILTDDSLDSAFLYQANEMLFSLFYSKNVEVSINHSKAAFEKHMKLVDFLSYFQGDKSLKVKIDISDFKIEDSLNFAGRKHYSGEISCLFSVQNIGNDKTILPNGIYNTVIKIESRKTEKLFGTIPKQIWEIFLGDIKLAAQDS
jgi:hypothetical protein